MCENSLLSLPLTLTYWLLFVQPEELEQGWFRECHLVSKGPVEVLILHKDVSSSSLSPCLPVSLSMSLCVFTWITGFLLHERFPLNLAFGCPRTFGYLKLSIFFVVVLFVWNYLQFLSFLSRTSSGCSTLCKDRLWTFCGQYFCMKFWRDTHNWMLVLLPIGSTGEHGLNETIIVVRSSVLRGKLQSNLIAF